MWTLAKSGKKYFQEKKIASWKKIFGVILVPIRLKKDFLNYFFYN